MISVIDESERMRINRWGKISRGQGLPVGGVDDVGGATGFSETMGEDFGDFSPRLPVAGVLPALETELSALADIFDRFISVSFLESSSSLMACASSNWPLAGPDPELALLDGTLETSWVRAVAASTR